MSRERDHLTDHLTAAALAKWPKVPFFYQLEYAYHLFEACPECWATVRSAQLDQPFRLLDPFLRAVARIQRLPKVDLSLPSRAMHLLVYEPFRPHDFPLLLLSEEITLCLESTCYLNLSLALAKVLGESSAAETTGTDLVVNVNCALLERFLFDGQMADAETALGVAKSHVSDRCDGSTRANVMLAEFLFACWSGDKGTALEHVSRLTDEAWLLLRDDPVRRFEISCEVLRGLDRVGAADDAKTAAWPLAELEAGELGNVILRLNGLFHKARYAPAVAEQIPGLPCTVAAELRSAMDSVKEHGDLYSLGLYHQLRGELDGDETAFDDALAIFSALELEHPFFDAWRKFDDLLAATRSPQLAERRHHISKQAVAVFGKDVAERRIESMPWNRGMASVTRNLAGQAINPRDRTMGLLPPREDAGP